MTGTLEPGPLAQVCAGTVQGQRLSELAALAARYPGLCFTVRGDLREDVAPGEQRAEIWEAERDGGVIAVGGSMGDLWLQLAELGGETA